MKTKRIISLLLALALAVALLPTTALAVTTVNTIKITMTQPEVGKALPTDAEATTTSSYVTKVEWTGETDNGLMRGDRAYMATIFVEIKPDKDAKYTANADNISVTINGGTTGVSVARLSDTQVRVRYTLAAGGVPAFGVGGFTIDMSTPAVKKSLAKSPKTSNNSNVEVTSIEWTGELDGNGHVMYNVPYTVTMNVKIKDGNNAIFSLNGTTAYINKKDTPATFTRLSDTTGVVTHTFLISLEGKQDENAAKAEASIAEQEADLASRRLTLAEADAKRPLSNPITIVVNKDTVNGSPASYVKATRNRLTTLDGQTILDVLTVDGTHSATIFRITGVVYDLYTKEPTGTNNSSFTDLPNVKAIWLSPEADIEGFLNSLPRGRRNSDDDNRNHFGTYDRIVLIPASLFPNGPTYAGNSPSCRVMLYDGDVYEAAKKGVSAARDWCTNHSYTAKYLEPDRWLAAPTCTEGSKYYYSCSKCGKIEYNANHTWDANAEFGIKQGGPTAHSFTVENIADEHFICINLYGDRVYLKSCEFCGRDERQIALNATYEEWAKGAAEVDRNQSTYQLSMSRRKAAWAEGGSTYKTFLTIVVGTSTGRGFAIASATYVTARTSGWAKGDVNTASEQGLIDKTLLGEDYTKAITRLQFASVAVKMTEKMLGKPITPAPAGTFTDTDNAYALKAYAAGITTGDGSADIFNPNGTLTRQQMATFLYRALQYVKVNSDARYSPYDSKLNQFPDAGQVASWAKDAMAFMNAFDLIKGSDGKLAPNASCPIEQAVIVALRSLDAPRLGWYQNIGDRDRYGGDTTKAHMYGDRIWVTSIYTSGTGGSTKLHGNCIDPYGHSSTITLSKNLAPVREP